MKISGTLDIECATWDRFAVASTYQPTQDGAGNGETTIHRSIAHLVDHLLARPKTTWWAHAGGNYDFLAIAEELRKRGIPCSVDLAGARVSRIVGGGIVLRDSWPLVPLSLHTACALAGERAPVLGLPCRCGLACGGYCQIRPSDARRVVADYCAADARVLYRVLVAVRQHGADLELEMRGTLGGTAWATAKKALNLPDADLPSMLWRQTRTAYFGGRITIARPRADGPGSHWDISSAYPAALATTPVPHGQVGVVARKDALSCLVRDRPGIYSCEVTVPEMFLPPLPVRQGDRVTYPIGTFRGCWTLHELRAAIVRGVKIGAVHWAVVWEHSSVLFEDLIETWWRARARAGKKTPLGEWLRLLSNSLTGKFAQGPERKSARMFPDEIKICEAKKPCSRTRCVGACGAYEQLDMWGQVWGVPFYRPANSGHVQWAAYLTAATRERWLVGAESQGLDLVYGDTDSIWTTSRVAPQPSGAGLGRWEYKHAWQDWECAAPRAYRYVAQDGARETKTAGMRISDEEWSAGTAASDRGVLSFVEAARSGRGLFRRRHQGWTLPTRGKDGGWYGDRLLDVEERIAFPVSYGRTQDLSTEKGRIAQGV
jgi:hypothetical protein